MPGNEASTLAGLQTCRVHTHMVVHFLLVTPIVSHSQLVESEMVAKNCKSRCEERGIPFYRFSPNLDDVIAAGEIDTEKLLSMIIQTKLQTSKQGLGELVEMFYMVAAATKRASLTSGIKETEETEIENSTCTD